MAKILIVEDVDFLRDEMQILLEFEGYEVAVIEDGEFAMQFVREFHPDLILCDIMMPGKHGYDFLVELRADPEFSDLAFIFVTAKVGKEDRFVGLNLGADEYLTKPFTHDELLTLVQQQLD